ncbi:MAG: hypothetical protein ACMXYM_00430 [Candidatus Woesearchaeota archaeon]
MIPTAKLYAFTGAMMIALLASMIFDALVPTVTHPWLATLAHPLIATVTVAICLTLVFERSVREGSFAFFIAAVIALFTSLINAAFVSMVGTGEIPLALTVLASLSIRTPYAWIVVAVSGLATVLSGGILLSSLFVSVIIGAVPTVLVERWNDA